MQRVIRTKETTTVWSEGCESYVLFEAFHAFHFILKEGAITHDHPRMLSIRRP